MSVFLAPDLNPFYAGTYFPPVLRYNMPAFKDILSGLANAWKNDKSEVQKVGDQIISHLQNQNQSKLPPPKAVAFGEHYRYKSPKSKRL
jgi:uncharacterized protein YyaL (SSP411 family)